MLSPAYEESSGLEGSLPKRPDALLVALVARPGRLHAGGADLLQG